jgi:hypothetical protein
MSDFGRTLPGGMNQSKKMNKSLASPLIILNLHIWACSQQPVGSSSSQLGDPQPGFTGNMSAAWT